MNYNNKLLFKYSPHAIFIAFYFMFGIVSHGMNNYSDKQHIHKVPPLHHACDKGNIIDVKNHLKRDADILIKDYFNKNIFHHILLYSPAHTRNELLYLILDYAKEKGIDISHALNELLPKERDKDTSTPLYLAIAQERDDIVREFLKRGAALDVLTDHRQNAFHIVGYLRNQKNRTEIQNIIVHHTHRNKLDITNAVNQRNEKGATPSHLAATNGDGRFLWFLLINNAQLDIKDKRGENVLQVLLSLNNEEIKSKSLAVILDFLTSYGIKNFASSVNEKTYNKQNSNLLGNSFTTAITGGHFSTIKQMINYDIDLSVLSYKKQTVLHEAIYEREKRGREAVIDAILEKIKFDKRFHFILDHKNFEGLTPLMLMKKFHYDERLQDKITKCADDIKKINDEFISIDNDNNKLSEEKIKAIDHNKIELFGSNKNKKILKKDIKEQKFTFDTAHIPTIGLTNPGDNRCFINSVLRSLFSIVEFLKIMENGPEDKSLSKINYDLWKKTAELIEAMQDNDEEIEDTLVHTLIKNNRNSFNINKRLETQHDASEFLINYLNNLWPTVNKNPFHFKYATVSKCECGNEESTKADDELMLSLAIPKNAKTIKDCLSNFFSDEKIEYKQKYKSCNCKNDDAMKKIVIKEHPSNLIVNLIRFETIKTNIEKINTDISIDASTNIGDVAYEPISIILHGGNIYGGHYIAMTKVGSKFYIFDDGERTEMSNNEFYASLKTGKLVIKNKDYLPYVIFYKKIISEESMSNNLKRKNVNDDLKKTKKQKIIE